MPVSAILSTEARTPAGPKQLVKQLTTRCTGFSRRTGGSRPCSASAQSRRVVQPDRLPPALLDGVEGHRHVGLGVDDAEGAAARKDVHQGLSADLPAPTARERR